MLYVYVFVCAGSRLFCCVVPNSQRFPYAIGNAVFSAFWFFVPGSRNSYVAAFKLSVYAQPHVARLAARLRMRVLCSYTIASRMLTGVELAPATVARLVDEYYVVEATVKPTLSATGLCCDCSV